MSSGNQSGSDGRNFAKPPQASKNDGVKSGAGTQQQRPSGQGLPPAELNHYILEYLHKKGYTRTEQMLRVESSRTPTPAVNLPDHQGGPTVGKLEPAGGSANVTDTSFDENITLYKLGYAKLTEWIDSSLDLYKPELRRILYPLFVHIFLELVKRGYPEEAKSFFEDNSGTHAILHGDDIAALSAVSLPSHLAENPLASAFMSQVYCLRVSRTTLDLLLYYLHEVEARGGSIMIRLLNQYMDIRVVHTRPSIQDTEGVIDSSEGLPGIDGKLGVDKFNSQPVKLGKLPQSPEFTKEVGAVLENQVKSKPGDEESVTLNETFKAQVKEEEEDQSKGESPSRDAIPLPPHKAVDIEAEISRIRDARSRIKLGPSQTELPSVCMYTFHNTRNELNTIEFSEDSTLVAGGFSDSFVKIWSLKGEKLSGILKDDEPSTTKQLIGHSGPVYGLSFSPDNRYLLSSSEDKTVRLWSLDSYSALVSYKGHNHPVWDVKFGPFGHYFATASHDQTARLWSCDHIYPLRIFAGHLSDVESVCFHPNGNYIITGSADKTARMWDVNSGNSIRVFIGHTGAITCTAVSPDGRWLATAGDDSIINLWDLGSGRRLKSMRGHGHVPIYSLAFSNEGSVLVSGAADNSVRVWDVKKGTNDALPEPEPLAVQESKDPNGNTVNDKHSSKIADSDGRRRREVVATPDHLSVFYTKRTPVYKVSFTRRNLCLAGGEFTG